MLTSLNAEDDKTLRKKSLFLLLAPQFDPTLTHFPESAKPFRAVRGKLRRSFRGRFGGWRDRRLGWQELRIRHRQ